MKDMPLSAKTVNDRARKKVLMNAHLDFTLELTVLILKLEYVLRLQTHFL